MRYLNMKEFIKRIENNQEKSIPNSIPTPLANPIPKSKMKINSKGDMRPQISIREICTILDLPLPDMSAIDIDKKRNVSTTTWAMKEGGGRFYMEKIWN